MYDFEYLFLHAYICLLYRKSAIVGINAGRGESARERERERERVSCM